MSVSGFMVNPVSGFTPNKDEVELLAEEQIEGLEAVAAGHNVLFHGPAGTGKSVTLARVRRMLDRKGSHYAVCAYTATAAVNVDGTTIHGLFSGLGLMKADVDVLWRKMRRNPTLLARIKSLQVLIIDEISLVSASFLEKIGALMGKAMSNTLPFGGKQVVFSGDFYQLPPIEKGEDGSTFAFQSKVWAKAGIKQIEFTRVFRQADPVFVRMLHRMRIGKLSVGSMAMLIKLIARQFDDDIWPTSLFSTNNDADVLNARKLKELDQETERKFVAACDVVPKKGASMALTKELYKLSLDKRKHSRAPEELVLRVGAQVMLRWNLDLPNKLVNGSRGVLVRYSKQGWPVVRFATGHTREICPVDFVTETPGGKITYRQVPLILAWGFTIHKSQGATLDRVSISTARIFQEGQAYVAFSRVRSLDGLRITDFDPRSVRVSEIVRKHFPVSPQIEADTDDEGEDRMDKQQKEDVVMEEVGAGREQLLDGEGEEEVEKKEGTTGAPLPRRSTRNKRRRLQ